ncbi:hypothetical protein [Alistipes indistinctus]|uniref:hypothetical protein n=1 Tax=Alistipes indistinctus TaxID=626932 RepID=UPI003520B071
MNRLFPPVTLLAFCLCTGATAQTAAKTSATPSPKTAPAVVTPAPGDVLIPAPSDAQVLFDGKDLAQWCRKDGSPAAWTVENGDMVVKAKSGNIQTKRNFGGLPAPYRMVYARKRIGHRPIAQQQRSFPAKPL